jgi:hypothetical protein
MSAPDVKVIMSCRCGQKNRVIVGSTAKCGACGQQLAGFATPTLDNFADRLHASSASEAFGRMHFPEDYRVCSVCGVTYHVHDAARHTH